MLPPTGRSRGTRLIAVTLTIALLAVIIVPLATRAAQQGVSLAAGDSITLSCATSLSGAVQGQQATITCAAPAPTTPPATGSGPRITAVNGVASGASIGGTVAIEAIVEGTKIDRVVFDLSGPKAASHTERRAPYFFMGDTDGTPNGWDTRAYPDGAYRLDIRAFNTAGQSASATVSFTIANGGAPQPTATAQPQPTAAPQPSPTMPPMDGSVGACGESMEMWHPPVVTGPDGKPCSTGHEHGDAPPDWIAQAGYHVMFHGHFNTSPAENTAKHAAMKGFSARFNNVDIYFRVHAASNPLDRSARYHSYEVWARDPSGAVSHWQLWYNSGDPRPSSEGGARVPRRASPLPAEGQRPIILVVDQQAQAEGINCEQWYSAPGEPQWAWDFGWTICNATTLYKPGENATAADMSTWTPTGSLGTERRLEAAWYSNRQHPTGTFYSTQFGEIVSGPNDPRCSGTTDKFGTTYQNVCLDQTIQPTLPSVAFPNNATQKTFDGSGVKIPN